jgi:hypothetical protein
MSRIVIVVFQSVLSVLFLVSCCGHMIEGLTPNKWLGFFSFNPVSGLYVRVR